LLISVTNFFRDAEAFAVLQSHIPQLFADKAPSDQLRVWVTGCATGEEAYSVAMLLLEHAEKLKTPPAIQVFATDLDDNAIQVARAGLYPATIEADVSPERLRRFFSREEGAYRIKKDLRERVLFSVHNLLKDSPFSRLDVVTCRNLLIYLKRDAQEGVLDLFHFALRAGGLLFLGSAESVSEGHVLFAPLDRQHRLFVRRATPRAGWQLPALSVTVPYGLRPSTSISSHPLLPATAESANPAVWTPSPSATGERRVSPYGELHLSALEQFAPPSILVNAGYDIMHLSEHAGRFLQFAGEISRNLLDVVHPTLRAELRTALFRAGHQHINVTTSPLLFGEGTSHFVTLHVRAARASDPTQEYFLVIFESTAEAIEASPPPPLAPDAFTRRLEDEILHLRTQLAATVEQYEASLEELKASSEEQQSINEEMRSAAEELETSKEELQSTNEELTTVNQELKSSVDELSRANGDLQNLMASTEIGTVFLDRQLRIKRYTPRIRELFNIIPTDVGRPLSDITHKLNHHPFTEDAERVLTTLARSEREVRNNGNYFLARMLPYRTPDDYIDGVVLTFIDITERKKAEEALREAETRMRLIVESARDYAIFTTDLQRRVSSWNVGAQALFGYGEAEILGRPGDILFTPEDRAAGVPQREVETAQVTGRAENERWHSRKDGSHFYGSGMVTPLRDDAGNHIGFVKVMRDLTEQKQVEEALAASEEKYRTLFTSIDEGFCTIEVLFDERGKAVDCRFIETNPAFARQTGLENVVGATMRELTPQQEEFWFETYGHIARTGEAMRFEHAAAALGKFYDVYAFRIGEAGENRVAVIFNDIFARKQAEAGMRESEERLRIAVESADMGTWDWNLLTNEVRWNARHFTLLGMEPHERFVSAEEFFRHVYLDDRDRIRERLEQTLRDRVVFEAEFRVVREDGAVCWMSGYGNIVEETNGKPLRMSGGMMDITRRKDVEEALRLEEERYRLTVENIRDYAIFTLDTEGHVTSWSEGARRVKGYEPHEIIGQHFRVFYIPEDQESRKPEHEMEHAAATGRNEDESWRVRRNGSRFWGNEITTAIRDATGALRGFVKISRDLTERKRAEEQRLALEHETTLLTERNRMAQELHDTLAQGFTGIRMQLEMAQSSLQAAPPEAEEGLQRVVRAREIAHNSHQEARRSIRALRSPLLESATLPEALERLASEASDSIKVGFALEGTPFPLLALVENDLYRIGQEAVTNAVRHSGAQRIVITLTYFDDQAHLSIVDDGRGFDPQGGRAGFGITGMQERARRLGADLQLASQPGQGTQVNLAYHIPAGQGQSAL
jgi:two-component system, chemotaxis family, CheB/CheR fusion protein